MTDLDKRYQELVQKKADLEKQIKIKRLEKEIQQMEMELQEPKNDTYTLSMGDLEDYLCYLLRK